MTWFGPNTSTIAGLLEQRGRLHPHRVMFREGERTVTYGEMVAVAPAVAAGLAADGIAAGDRLAMIAEHTIESWKLLLGCAVAGVVPVLLNWRLAPPELEFIVGDAGCVALTTTERFEAMAAALDLPDELRRPNIDVWTATLAERIPDAPPAAPSFAESAAAPISGDSDLVQLYTSGTTGLPKGVRTSNAALCALLDAMGSELAGVSADSVHLAAAPLFHIAGYGYALAGLLRGAETVLLGIFDPGEAGRLIETHRCTNSLLVPAMLQAVVEEPSSTGRDFSSLRGVLYGASPISVTLIQRVVELLGCRLTQAYGLTETSGLMTFLRWDDHEAGLAAIERGDTDGPAARRLASAGYPYPGSEVAVLDESGRRCPDGVPGEIVGRGPLTMTGYWNRPEVEAIDDDGWFRSGDIGYLADGYLYLVDRLNDKIVTKGENVYPGEVERVLGEHPSVLELAVVGVPDDDFGEALTAVVVLRGDATLTLREAQDHCRPHLAGYKLPRRLVISDTALPRTPSGKVLRRTVREPYWAGLDRRVH